MDPLTKMRLIPFGGLLSLGVAIIGVWAGARPLLAQKGSAAVFGTVVNKVHQGPIPDAVISHAGDGRVVKSDSLGFYQFPELKAGIVRFIVRARGYPTSTFSVALTNGEHMERDVELDNTAPRPPELPLM